MRNGKESMENASLYPGLGQSSYSLMMQNRLEKMRYLIAHRNRNVIVSSEMFWFLPPTEVESDGGLRIGAWWT